METCPSTGSLELVETCFAGLYRDSNQIFKVRVPLKMRIGDAPVDLSSIDRRRAACLEEADLDRRLTPGLVLGVVPLTRDADGTTRFGGQGAPVDWALHMRRLPDSERADRRLAAGNLTDGHLHSVASRLAVFHESARGGAGLEASAMLDRLRALVTQRIEAPGWRGRTALPDEIDRIEAWQLAFLDAEAERFGARAENDAIGEGHGELTLEHVFIDDAGEARILAGLELGPRLRNVDVTCDVALLAGDLAARHRVDLAERFVADYARIANDFDLYPLLDFYASLCASLRGKLAWLCADGSPSESTRARKTRERARRLFALALAAPRRPLLPPIVVAMGGQVASGKSTVANRIARSIGAPTVGSDATRDFLLGARLNEELHEARWEEAYEPGFGARVYDEVLRRAGEVLASGRPVVIDGCFRSAEQRIRARALAERFGHPFLFVEATIPEGIQLERLAERSQRDDVPLAAWKEIADQMRAGWEPVKELPGEEYLALDTALPLEQNAATIEVRLPTWPAGLTG